MTDTSVTTEECFRRVLFRKNEITRNVLYSSLLFGVDFSEAILEFYIDVIVFQLGLGLLLYCR